jgi:hypothetical protein
MGRNRDGQRFPQTVRLRQRQHQNRRAGSTCGTGRRVTAPSMTVNHGHCNRFDGVDGKPQLAERRRRRVGRLDLFTDPAFGIPRQYGGWGNAPDCRPMCIGSIPGPGGRRLSPAISTNGLCFSPDEAPQRTSGVAGKPRRLQSGDVVEDGTKLANSQFGDIGDGAPTASATCTRQPCVVRWGPGELSGSHFSARTAR